MHRNRPKRMSARYTGTAISTGDGRAAGRARTDDGLLDLELVLPPEMGGPGGATNPEQLFAAGWASCFHSSFKTVAARRGCAIVDSAVVAAVQLHSTADGRLTLSAALHVDVSGVGQVTAEELALAAHATCPYSVATTGNIPVSVTVRAGERFR